MGSVRQGLFLPVLPTSGKWPALREGGKASVDLFTECSLVSSQGCCSSDRRSCHRRCSACGAGRRRLHWGRNHRLLLSGQNDVSGRHRQWGRSSFWQPGSDSTVHRSSWTVPVIQNRRGLCGVCSGSPRGIAPCSFQRREEDNLGPCSAT
uniref:Interferon alpha inducible protein 27 n=1 Tax=Molossus molossus TaxID=27622 RepID=A0A7J8JU16_MOLMO|nr:interferon alpha inducible protein 27 [Molossus molossus]